MALTKVQRVDRLINRIDSELPSSHVYWEGACSDARITCAEKTLGIHFPKSFRRFLALTGGGGYVGEAGAVGLLGIRPSGPISESPIPFFVNEFRSRDYPFPPPEGMIPILYDPSYTAVVFLDTSKMMRGECPAVSYDLANGTRIEAAADFISYFEELIDAVFASVADESEVRER